MIEVRLSDTFLAWHDGIRDVRAKTIIVRRLLRLAEGNRGDWKPVGASLFEIRINYGPGYRVYCKEKGNEIIIILGGGTKNSQQQDIEKAKKLAQEQEERL